jgi:hypothetical protein
VVFPGFRDFVWFFAVVFVLLSHFPSFYVVFSVFVVSCPRVFAPSRLRVSRQHIRLPAAPNFTKSTKIHQIVLFFDPSKHFPSVLLQFSRLRAFA